MSNVVWPTAKVAVVATYNGTLRMPASDFKGAAFRAAHDPRTWCRNSSEMTFVVYQRTDPSLPHYSANLGFEAGVIVQFIVDHYQSLPNVTVFIQDQPEVHNPHWRAWTRCLRSNLTYTPMAMTRLVRKYRANAQTNAGTDVDDAVIEQCWRDILDAFGLQVFLPREQPIVAYFPGGTFAASRRTLQSTPLATWKRLHSMLAGGDGRCHRGPLEWERLSTPRRAHTRTLDTSDGRGKHTAANAFEALQHVLIGGMSRVGAMRYDFCSAFIPDCPKSPCSSRRAAGALRMYEKYAAGLEGRIEHERRRLGREYTRLLASVRRVAAGEAPPSRELGRWAGL